MVAAAPSNTCLHSSLCCKRTCRVQTAVCSACCTAPTNTRTNTPARYGTTLFPGATITVTVTSPSTAVFASYTVAADVRPAGNASVWRAVLKPATASLAAEYVSRRRAAHVILLTRAPRYRAIQLSVQCSCSSSITLTAVHASMVSVGTPLRLRARRGARATQPSTPSRLSVWFTATYTFAAASQTWRSPFTSRTLQKRFKRLC